MFFRFVLAFNEVFRIFAELKPASLNSFRKATPSFAPAIQENQSSSSQTFLAR
jgi:hypothetical protein